MGSERAYHTKRPRLEPRRGLIRDFGLSTSVGADTVCHLDSVISDATSFGWEISPCSMCSNNHGLKRYRR